MLVGVAIGFSICDGLGHAHGGERLYFEVFSMKWEEAHEGWEALHFLEYFMVNS